MVSHQPLPTLLLQFERETSVTPGAKCEGNSTPDAIRTGKAGCLLGYAKSGNTPAFIILGDSHARMWTAGLDALATKHQQSVLMLGYSSCTPLINYTQPTRHECVEILKNSLDYIVHSPVQKIVLAGYWVDAIESMKSAGYSSDSFTAWLGDTVSALNRAGKTVLILRDIPELQSEQTLREHFMRAMRNRRGAVASMNIENHRSRQYEADQAITLVRQTYAVHVLDPAMFICPDNRCLVAEGGRTLYRDKHHLTDFASRKFAEVFEPLFAPGL